MPIDRGAVLDDGLVAAQQRHVSRRSVWALHMVRCEPAAEQGSSSGKESMYSGS